jgi:prepilin-type N-terminal cleavage/methylation domain-containing protein
MMKTRAFTLLELLLTLSILAILLTVGIPIYKKFTIRKALQNSAVILERTIQERKQRAVSLGDWTGLCIQKNGLVDSYSFNPFGGTPRLKQILNLSSSFGIHLVIADSNPTFSYPCGSHDINIRLSPDPNFSRDWSGTLSLQSGGAAWQLAKNGDLLNNEP